MTMTRNFFVLHILVLDFNSNSICFPHSSWSWKEGLKSTTKESFPWFFSHYSATDKDRVSLIIRMHHWAHALLHNNGPGPTRHTTCAIEILISHCLWRWRRRRDMLLVHIIIHYSLHRRPTDRQHGGAGGETMRRRKIKEACGRQGKALESVLGAFLVLFCMQRGKYI